MEYKPNENVCACHLREISGTLVIQGVSRYCIQSEDTFLYFAKCPPLKKGGLGVLKAIIYHIWEPSKPCCIVRSSTTWTLCHSESNSVFTVIDWDARKAPLGELQCKSLDFQSRTVLFFKKYLLSFKEITPGLLLSLRDTKWPCKSNFYNKQGVI